MHTLHQSGKRLLIRCSPFVMLGLGALRLFAQEQSKPETAKETLELPVFNVQGDTDKRGYQSSQIYGANRMVVPIENMDGSAFVLGRELFKDLAPRNLADIAKYVAGVEQPRYYSPWDNIVIRGNEDGTNLVDGFAVRGLDYVPLALVEQVEVIKGAQGVLYGTVSGGGIINRVMKQPQRKAAGEIVGQVGIDNYYSGQIDLTGPIPQTTNGAYRLISSISRGGGRQKNLLTQSPQQVFAGSVKFGLPGGGSISAYADYVDREWTPANELTSGDPTTGLFDADRFRDYTSYVSAVTWTTNERIAVVAEKMLGPVASRLAFQYLDNLWYDDTIYPCCGNTIAPEPLFARYRKNTTKNTALIYDGVWKFNFGEAVANITNFGISYEKESSRALQLDNNGPNFDYGTNNYANPSRSFVRFNLLSPHNVVSSNNTGELTNTSLYANWRGSILNERLSLIGGARLQSYSKGQTNLRNPASSFPNKKDDVTLYRMGAVAQLTKSVSAYVSYGETFTINTGLGYIPPGSTVGQGDFLPDAGSENLEGGFHINLYDRRLTIGASYYELSQTGRYRGGNSSFEPIVALPDNTNTGFEFQVTATPVDNWVIIASLTKAKVHDVGGARSPDYAEDLANFFTKYTIRNGPAKGFGFGVGMNYYGDKVPSALPSGSAGVQTGYMIPAETTYDAVVSYEANNWLLQLNGRNITDNVFVNRFGGSLLSVWANAGRSWVLSASYKW